MFVLFFVLFCFLLDIESPYSENDHAKPFHPDIKSAEQHIGTASTSEQEDIGHLCPAFGVVCPAIKTVGFSKSHQQKSLQLALFSHGYTAIACSSEAYCSVGKGLLFHGHTHIHSHTLTHTLIHTHFCIWLIHFAKAYRLHDLSEPMSRTFRGVANSLQHFSLISHYSQG